MQYQVETATTIFSSWNIGTASPPFLTRLFHKEESHISERNGLKIMDVQQRYFLAT
jgi:hypothetical protein